MSGGRDIRRGRSVDAQKIKERCGEVCHMCSAPVLGMILRYWIWRTEGEEKICRQSTWFSGRFGTCWSWRKEVRRG